MAQMPASSLFEMHTLIVVKIMDGLESTGSSAIKHGLKMLKRAYYAFSYMFIFL